MDRRNFLKMLGLGVAATAALVVPGTEEWEELTEPRRRWWQGWGGQSKYGGGEMRDEWGTSVFIPEIWSAQTLMYRETKLVFGELLTFEPNDNGTWDTFISKASMESP